MLGTWCTFLGPSRKRSLPKGYIDAIEARLHQTHALLGIMLATSDPRTQSLLWQDIVKDPLATGKEIITRVDGVKGRKRSNSGKDPINNANVLIDSKGHSIVAGHGLADDPENSYSGQTQDVNTPTEPCNIKAQIFPGASDLSICHSEFNNVAGNFTKNTYINHVYPQPGSEPEQLSLKDHLSRAISELKSELKSEIFHAIETVKDVIETFKDAIETVKELLPFPFSTTADIPLEEKVAEDAHKYPPLSQGTILLSKTSLYIPGVMNQLLSSVRYSFYS
ncbi:uncharacterized protein LACBIDRAFT_302006 [Laccaria bicolor S238N-H82]|uniref:Predicted protein n=1 Tax=Laccaria bicolor (strain S238N-H82 / ATCC MYA-4686) TaxID=486041 RepID=B0CQC5_LACBS|nr:uncharacterized protein LACBIDRAFT_302006 [Laccaria bicolor S238N-H82]EDR16181.1 predicted protein [Laccaria bicolor S238N-H82]|eukprot:XP_001874389.1 predicted protein [Laccaria bicolor S238N-H82]